MACKIKFLLGIAFGLVSLLAVGQKKVDYNVYGIVKDRNTREFITDVEISIIKDGQFYDRAEVDEGGHYNFLLPMGSSYDLTFARQGYMPMKLRFDTQTIPVEDRKGGFENMLEIRLFEFREGFRLSIMNKPFGIFSFNSAKNFFDFDENYTMSILDEIQAENKRLDELFKTENQE